MSNNTVAAGMIEVHLSRKTAVTSLVDQTARQSLMDEGHLYWISTDDSEQGTNLHLPLNKRL